MATTPLEPWIGRPPCESYEGYRRHRLTCGKKKQYVTRDEAEAALERWVGTCPPGLGVYACTTCGGWHHGHGPQH
jgi:hypothetical protein